MATAVLLPVAACAPYRRAEPVPRLPTFPAFRGAPDSQPAVSSGRAGWPIMAVDPDIYVDAEGYHLFYTTRFCRPEYGYSYSWDPANPSACHIIGALTTIGYAFSGDRGLTWSFRRSPVVMPSHTDFGTGRLETAHVFRIGDTLYLTFSADEGRAGRGFTARYQIGIARLELGRQSVQQAMMDEGRQFQRRNQPLLASDPSPGRFDNNVQEPSVVIGPDGILLYYIGLGLKLPDQPIGATGQGIVSIGLGRAVLDDQLNVVRRSDSALLRGVNMPEVRYFHRAYHVFATTLSARELRQSDSISYATSVDGIHWNTPRVILSPGSHSGFNDWGVMAPTVAIEPNRVILFYTAYGTTPRACFPVPPDGRFGLPVADDSKCLFTTIGRAISALGRNDVQDKASR